MICLTTVHVGGGEGVRHEATPCIALPLFAMGQVLCQPFWSH